MEDLKPEETQVIGMWLDLGSKVVGDAVYDRIEWLAAERLELLGEKPDGLSRLYRDPRDGRKWEYERPFPGGPPQLVALTEEEAKVRWQNAA